MTDPMAGTRAHRARVAAEAIAAYEAWIKDDGRELDPPFATFGTLVTVARWLLEMTETAPDRSAAAQFRIAQANAAVAGLNARQLRDVLYALAADQPRAVLAAIAEAGL